MLKSFTMRSGVLIALVISLFVSSFATAQLPQRTISIAGLVVNSQTLLPVESAQIFDANGSKLGSTDKNGYYKIDMNILQDGEIFFKLKITKPGFRDITQTEHWGSLGNTQKLMYFGLQESKSNASSFSSFGDFNKNNSDLSYNSVLAGFGNVKKQRGFDNQLENAKAGNQDVFIQIDGKYYIVDDSGWIQLNSDKDLISIDNKQVVSADKLNSIVKRKNVTGMTPVNSPDAKFLIHTK